MTKNNWMINPAFVKAISVGSGGPGRFYSAGLKIGEPVEVTS